MKFRNQNEFKGHLINNVLNKPVMHKKGKRWIVVSLSALMLFGLGTASTADKRAHADTTKPQSTQVIQNKAAQLNHKLLLSAVPQKPAQSKSVTTATGVQKPSNQHQLGMPPADTDPDVDQKYNFDASDKMYDTPKNDYLNNVNNLATDSRGQSIRAQIRLTYGFNQANPSQPYNNVIVPSINAHVIQDLNNSNIGILPLYCPGTSIRADSTIYPEDTALYHLNDDQRPEDSVGYQKMISEAKPVGYLLTAPRNTNFTPFFNKYFYLKSDNGMPLDTQNSEIVANNQDTSAPNNVYFSNVPNTDAFQSSYEGDTIDLEYKPQDDTIVYTYQGQPVGSWTSHTQGSANAQDPELLKMYDAIQQNNAPGMPAKYYISDATFNQFLNTLYNQTAYQQTHTTPGMNYGRHYTIPVVIAQKPETNTIKYMYNGHQVGEWMSPSTGNSQSVDSNLVNFYNTVSSTDAPGLPAGYYIPDGATPDHPEYNSDHNPLNDFFQIYPATAQNEDAFDYGKDYTIDVDVPYSQVHIKYFENGQPADIPEQTINGKTGSAIGLDVVNQLANPSGYHLQKIRTNGNTEFTGNSQEIDVDLVSDKTNTITKTVPGPTKYITKNVPGPTKIIHDPGKTITKYVTKNVPGPTKYITKNIPGPTKIIHDQGKTVIKYINKTVPGPTKYITKTVPGPTKVIHDQGRTIVKYVNKNIPGPTKYITKTVPGPVKYVTRTIQGPTKVVNHDVIKTVKVPGPTQIIHEPGKVITKYVNVPGPLRVEKLPGKTITKVVYTPSPTKIVHQTIVKNVPGPTQIKYIHIPCKCKVTNHTKIVYVPKLVKEFIVKKHYGHKVHVQPHKVRHNNLSRIKHFKHSSKVNVNLHHTRLLTKFIHRDVKEHLRHLREHITKSSTRLPSQPHYHNKAHDIHGHKQQLPQTGDSYNYSFMLASALVTLSILSMMLGYDMQRRHSDNK